MKEKTTPDVACGATNVYPQVSLQCGEEDVNSIAYVPQYDLVAVSTYSDAVYIHERSTQGEPIRVFDEHEEEVNALIHICDDILASVDDDGMLLTWRAGTGVVQERLKVSEDKCFAITKAGAKTILISTERGEIIRVKHSNGKKLVVKKRFNQDVNERPYFLYACEGNILLVVPADHKVQVWNYSKGKRYSDIGNKNVHAVALSDGLIAMGGRDGKISVYRKHGHIFNLLRTIELCEPDWARRHKSYIRDVSFLNDDIVMVTTSYNGIFIVSAGSGQIITHFEIENSSGWEHTIVLSDGRLCVGGENGYCAILKPPKEGEDVIGQYAKGMREDTRRITGGDSGPVPVDSNRGGVEIEPSSSTAEKSEGRKISLLWKKIEMMEERAKEHGTEIGKMEQWVKEHEGEIDKMLIRIEEQGSEIGKLKVQNAEQEIEIAKMKLSNIRQEEKSKAQEEKIAELEIQGCKRRRIV